MRNDLVQQRRDRDDRALGWKPKAAQRLEVLDRSHARLPEVHRDFRTILAPFPHEQGERETGHYGRFHSSGHFGSTVSIVDIEVSDVSANGTNQRNFLRFDPAPLSTPCSLINGQWLVGGSADNIKYIMTLATSAKLAGRPVKVLWNQGAANQCSGPGTTGYPVVIGLLANTECGCPVPPISVTPPATRTEPR